MSDCWFCLISRFLKLDTLHYFKHHPVYLHVIYTLCNKSVNLLYFNSTHICIYTQHRLSKQTTSTPNKDRVMEKGTLLLHCACRVRLRDLIIFLGFSVWTINYMCQEALTMQIHYNIWMSLVDGILGGMSSLQILPLLAGISKISASVYCGFKDHGTVAWTL